MIHYIMEIIARRDLHAIGCIQLHSLIMPLPPSLLPPGDDALVMLKVLVKTQNGTTITSYYHVIDTTILSPAPSDNSSHKVTKMQLYGEGASAHVYIGTETDIYRIPVQSCSAHTSCCECVTTRDPYCGFDKAAGTCVSLSTSNSQNLTRDLVDGNTDVCLASVTIQAPVSTGKLCNSKSSSPTANTEGETTPSKLEEIGLSSLWRENLIQPSMILNIMF